MSRYWKAALPFLLAAVIILAAASRPVVQIGRAHV